MIAPPMMRPPMPRAGLAPAPQAAMRPPAAMPGVPRPMRDSGGDVPPVQSPKAPRPPKTPLTGKVHAGPINSAVAGRTDHLPVHVPEGAYVIPADVVGHLGESNNAAGFKVLKRMFSGLPRDAGDTAYDGAGGPYDAGPHPYERSAPLPYDAKMASGGIAKNLPTAEISQGWLPGMIFSKTNHGETMAWHKPHGVQISDTKVRNPNERGKGHGTAMYEALAKYAHQNGVPLLSDNIITNDAAQVYESLAKRGYGVVKNPQSQKLEGYNRSVSWSAPENESVFKVESPENKENLARGGANNGVPIVAAGGEHVLTPDEVRMAGAGDLDRGHRVLDKFVVRMRKELIHTLKKLPGPKRN